MSYTSSGLKGLYKGGLTKFKYQFMREKVINGLQNKFRYPKHLYIECVNICNAACVFCYYPEFSKTVAKKTMSVETFKSFVEQFASVGGESIGLTPTLGDPLVDKFFNERLRIIDSSKVPNLVFYTNLINLKESNVNAINSMRNTNIRIRVSITGFSKESYNKYMGVDSFEKVKKNLRLLSANIVNDNCNIGIILRKYQGSDFEIREFIKYLDKLDLNSTIEEEFDDWSGLVKFGMDQSKFKMIKKPEKRGPCQKAYSKTLITVDGNYKLCDVRDGKDQLLLGDASGENGLINMWDNDIAANFRKTLRIDGKIPDVCDKCQHYVSVYSLKLKDTMY